MLGTPEKESKRYIDQGVRLKPLHDRMEEAFQLWTLKPFEIPIEEGKWESVTTNSPAVLANSVAERIGGAERSLYILTTDEGEEERSKLTETERFVKACLELNDNIRMAIPEELPLQSMMGWTAEVCGIVVPRVYLYKDGDEFVCDVQAWDPRHVRWIPGRRGPVWVSHDRWASIDELKDTYGNDADNKCKPDKNGRVLILDLWDNDEEGVMPKDGSEYLDKQSHGLGHPPVRIMPVGSSPFVQRENTKDTIKYLGADVFLNNRKLYATSSRNRSMRATLVAAAAKRPLVIEWDSTKGGKAPKIKGDPTAAGSTIVLDIGKGQKLSDFVTQEMTQDANILQSELDAELSMGGAPPIAYGQVNQALPYGGISLLTDSAMQRIKPPHLTCERAFEFIASEIVSQFKSMSIGEVTLKGSEGSHSSYQVKLKPDQINDEWPFKCRLKLTLPKDEQIEIAVATQEVTSGLLSKRQAREKHQLVDDLDLTERLLDDEALDDIYGIRLRKHARYLYEQEGDIEGAMEILEILEERQEKHQQEKGVAVQPGIPIPAPPMAGMASRTTAAGRGKTGGRQ